MGALGWTRPIGIWNLEPKVSFFTGISWPAMGILPDFSKRCEFCEITEFDDFSEFSELREMNEFHDFSEFREIKEFYYFSEFSEFRGIV